MPKFEYRAIIETLAGHGVEFIVVGGIGAALQGAPLNTWDVDVLYRRESANIERALAALRLLDARFHLHPDLVPNPSYLESTGPKLLTTKLGRLDMLGTIGKALSYEDLIDQTDEMKLGEFRVRVLHLETLIQLKEELGRDKDLAVLPTLRATLAEKRRLK
jgi:predicted nucleotidyltransferase